MEVVFLAQCVSGFWKSSSTLDISCVSVAESRCYKNSMEFLQYLFAIFLWFTMEIWIFEIFKVEEDKKRWLVWLKMQLETKYGKRSIGTCVWYSCDKINVFRNTCFLCCNYKKVLGDFLKVYKWRKRFWSYSRNIIPFVDIHEIPYHIMFGDFCLNILNKLVLPSCVTLETRMRYVSIADPFNTLTATSKSHVSLRAPREYFYYSKHIMAK